MAYRYFRDEDGTGIVGLGATLAKAFEGAGKAIFNLVKNVKKTKPSPEKIELECSAEDEEELFMEWLEELLRESSVHGIIFSEIKITSMKNLRIKGWAKGIKSSKEINFEPTHEKLVIGRKNKLFYAKCIIKTV